MQIFGDDKVASDFRQMADRSVDARPVFERIFNVLLEGERKQFGSGGSYLGSSWAPLSDETKARKAQKGQPLQPMVATGATRRALTSKGAPGQRKSITRTQARLGLKRPGDLFYGLFHQIGAANNPLRKLVGTTKRERKSAVELFRRHLLP